MFMRSTNNSAAAITKNSNNHDSQFPDANNLKQPAEDALVRPFTSNSAQTATIDPLLHAWHDPLANLRTLPSCVELGDITGDGDSKLLVCDLDKKLLIYKGTRLYSEHQILDTPIALALIYTDNTQPRLPLVAVASGSHIFVYRQLRPFKKWICPNVELSNIEIDVWLNLKNNDMTLDDALKSLHEAKESGLQLSSRSLDFLEIDTGNKDSQISALRAFVDQTKDVPLVQNTVVTCMSIIKHESEDIDAVCHLVVGTESKFVYILPIDVTSPNGVCKVKLSSVPVMIAVTGFFSTEWRIAIVCRDGKIYTIRQGDVRGTALLSGAVIDLGSQAVAITKQDKNLWVATMDKMISCYSVRGKRIKCIVLNDDIIDISNMVLKKSKASNLLVVALATGYVQFYNDGSMIYSFSVEKPLIALKFGPYGREDNAMILIHGKGSLSIKIWKRTADIEAMLTKAGPPPEQDIPLNIPKKTKLYVEQTQREKDQAPNMHRSFHKDLCRMRLETARAYVKTLTEGYMGTATVGSADIRIQVLVLGLGPAFVLKITLQNAGNQALTHSKMMFTFDPALYVMGHIPTSKQCFTLAPLLPGVKHVVEAQVQNIDPQGKSGQILILLNQANTTSATPLLSASVKMPVSELAT